MALRKLTYGGPNFDPATFSRVVRKQLSKRDLESTMPKPFSMDSLAEAAGKPISTTPISVVQTTPTAARKPFDWTGTMKKLDQIAPYASNIINSFRRPPAPKLPHMDSEVGGGRHINMDNDRAMIERGVRSSNQAADANLDENTAASVKMANKAQRENSLSTVNQQERNTNISIDNAGLDRDAQIRARNNAKRDGYDNSVIERGIAMQNNASANMANAADKYMQIKNQKGLQTLEDKKIRLFYDTDKGGSGVSNRQLQRLNSGTDPDTNQPDVTTSNQIFDFSSDTPTPQQAPVKQKDAFQPLAVPNTYGYYPRQSTRVRFRALGGSLKSYNAKRMMSVHR